MGLGSLPGPRLGTPPFGATRRRFSSCSQASHCRPNGRRPPPGQAGFLNPSNGLHTGGIAGDLPIGRAARVAPRGYEARLHAVPRQRFPFVMPTWWWVILAHGQDFGRRFGRHVSRFFSSIVLLLRPPGRALARLLAGVRHHGAATLEISVRWFGSLSGAAVEGGGREHPICSLDTIDMGCFCGISTVYSGNITFFLRKIHPSGDCEPHGARVQSEGAGQAATLLISPKTGVCGGACETIVSRKVVFWPTWWRATRAQAGFGWLWWLKWPVTATPHRNQ
jgi:hypothetical protein